MDPEADDPMLGQILSDTYRVTGVLGRGGMGAVYRAAHLRLPRQVAIKIVQKELVTDPATLGRFRREAEIASQVGSEHLVQVFDFHENGGSPYLVMELLEGEDLAQRLDQRGGKLPLGETRRIIEQVVKGLAAAHKLKVVHRDLKPANLFLVRAHDQVDFVKILDFGLSKIVGSKRLTRTDMAVGTPEYMSPEQCRGSDALDHRSDIYSLGAVLFEMLTGTPPFTGEIIPLLTKIVTEEPPSLCAMAPELPYALDVAIQKALSKDPEDRQQSVEDFWDDVKRAVEATALRSGWLAGGSVKEPPPVARPGLGKLGAARPATLDGTEPTEISPRLPMAVVAAAAAVTAAPAPATSKRWWAGGLGVAALLGLGALVLHQLQTQPAAPQTVEVPAPVRPAPTPTPPLPTPPPTPPVPALAVEPAPAEPPPAVVAEPAAPDPVKKPAHKPDKKPRKLKLDVLE